MDSAKTVVAIFVDIRGFTKWSTDTEVFAHADRFVTDFLDIIETNFPSPAYYRKPLGDGAMLVREVEEDLLSDETLAALLAEVLKGIEATERAFGALCKRFSRGAGHATKLELGWGVVRGKALELTNEDWTGPNLNKAARLCSVARPFGIVIDQDDFPDAPDRHGLVSQVRRLEGIGEVRVWVTPEIASQFVPREHLREEPEVHVAGTCVAQRNGKWEVLIARRGPHRRLYAGKWEGCGGQLRRSESFAAGVQRHFRLNLGLEVQVLVDFHCFYEIKEPDTPLIPGIRFLCRVVGGAPPAATADYTEVKWVSEDEFRRMDAGDFVGDLRNEVLDLLARFRQSRAGPDIP